MTVARPSSSRRVTAGSQRLYPETGVSAEVVAALAALPVASTPLGRRSQAYGVNWTLGMQTGPGASRCADPDGPAAFFAELPFAGGETVTDARWPM